MSSAARAEGDHLSRTIKVTHGKAKIEIVAGAPDAVPSHVMHPKLGVAPTPAAAFSSFLARAFDDGQRVTVVPPSRLPDSSNILTGGSELVVRSEFDQAIASACRGAHLDYLLVMGTPRASVKTDVTSFIGIGATHMRNRQEARLYECRSRKTVWVAEVLLETSYATFASAFNGNSTRMILGDPDAYRAWANVFAEKLSGDMGW
jgi:hypothetical protein